MKRRVLIIGLILLGGLVIFINGMSREVDRIVEKRVSERLGSQANQNRLSTMILTSSAFEESAKIPPKFTCDGDPPAGGINPELLIHNVPDAAKSLALIVDDPDAPRGTFVHWVVYNIDPNTSVIKEESVPPGSNEGANGSGKYGYVGPCPPDKKPHRYFFKLYALDIVLPAFDVKVTKEFLEGRMDGHVLDTAELIGIYER